jgi:hypothetical protein
MGLLASVGVCAALAGGVVAASAASAATVPGAQAVRPAAVGTTLWAKVASNGTLLASSGIGSVNHFGRGRYNLSTSVDISNCALTGTVNTSGGSDPGPGSASILIGAVNGTTLFVRTATPSAQNPQTVDDDRPYSLAIFC